MTKELKTVSQINKEVTNLLKSYKNTSSRIQVVLEAIIDNYNSPDGLNHNSTPLNNLLKGLRKTDVELVKIYIKTVTNAVVYINAKGNFTLKLADNATDLLTNEKYATMCWNDTADKVKVVPKEYFGSLKAAMTALDNTLPKAFKTARGAEELKELLDKVHEHLKAYESTEE